MNKLLLSIAAIVLLGLAAGAMADNKGPCQGGYWPDGKGCCPEIIKGKAYYRDYNNKCYPKEIKYNVFYADSNGCYPDEDGKYPSAGKDCPKYQKCEPRCIKPDDCHETTTEYCPEETTTKKHETTTMKQQTTTEHCPEETTTKKHETTTKKHETTTEYCPEETTTRKHETTTRKHKPTTMKHETTTKKHETTTEYCPEETTTRKHETTTRKQETTTHKHETEPRGPCPGGNWPDGCDCCPRKIGYSYFYRDGQGCYPIKTEKGVLYADGKGCYPDSKGNYLKAGEHCPQGQAVLKSKWKRDPPSSIKRALGDPSTSHHTRPVCSKRSLPSPKWVNLHSQVRVLHGRNLPSLQVSALLGSFPGIG